MCIWTFSPSHMKRWTTTTQSESERSVGLLHQRTELMDRPASWEQHPWCGHSLVPRQAAICMSSCLIPRYVHRPEQAPLKCTYCSSVPHTVTKMVCYEETKRKIQKHSKCVYRAAGNEWSDLATTVLNACGTCVEEVGDQIKTGHMNSCNISDIH